MDSPCIIQTVCKVLNIFQHGKYLVAHALNNTAIIDLLLIMVLLPPPPTHTHKGILQTYRTVQALETLLISGTTTKGPEDWKGSMANDEN